MPPKDKSKAEKRVEDATFGLKNKNKSKSACFPPATLFPRARRPTQPPRAEPSLPSLPPFPRAAEVQAFVKSVASSVKASMDSKA